MKAGILEKVMTRRYGQPTMSIRRGLPARCWNLDRPDESAALYVGMKWNSEAGARYASLKPIYGNLFGGFLIKDTLKVSILMPQEVYGVMNITYLRNIPEVRHAMARDPAIDYFMHEHGIKYFGLKRGEFYEYDIETDELDCLGPIEQALNTILEDWDEIVEEFP